MPAINATDGEIAQGLLRAIIPTKQSKQGRWPRRMVLGLLVAFIAYQTTRPIAGRTGLRVRVREAAHKRHASDRCQTVEVLGI